MTGERTCGGGCCAVFFYNLMDLDGVLEAQAEPRPETPFEQWTDHEKVIDMLIPLTNDQAEERSARFGLKPPRFFEDKTQVYTCRHWDEGTKLCTIYEQRPDMCSEYPYAEECTLCDGCKFVAPEPVRERWAEIRKRQAAERDKT